MILEQHYDDEVLIAFLGDPPAAGRDAHLARCPSCADTLHSLRSLAGGLVEPAVWELRELDETPRQATIDLLRARQAELRREDAAAFVKRLVAMPSSSWRTSVQTHPPRWPAETALALVARAERVVFDDPPKALTLSEIAVQVSVRSGDASAQSAALRELGYVLYFTGRYPEAVRATEKAEDLLTDRDPFQVARIALQRALIAGDMGDHEQSRSLAHNCADVFLRLGDLSRYVSARRTEAIALYKDRRYRDAVVVYESVRETAENLGGQTFAGLLQNLAICHRELGAFEPAIDLFLQSLDSFERLGLRAAATKCRWHLGRVFVAQGRFEDGLKQLRAVQESFCELSMAQDVALVTLDIAQVLAADGQTSEVIEHCRRAVEYFSGAGLSHSEGALTAIALIREGAEQGRLDEKFLLRARASIDRGPVLQLAFLTD